MGLLSALARSGRDDGESRLRHLERAGRSLTYLTIAGKVGRLTPDGILVIGFHGLGATESQLETLVPLDIPRGSTYLSLRGPYERGRDGFSWFDPPMPDSSESIVTAVDGVASFVEWARQMVGVDSAHTVLVGYSQAAPLMAAVGQLRPDLADRLVLASAALPEEVLALGPGSPRRAFVAIGRRDPLVDPNILDRLLSQWAATDVDVRTYDIPHVVSLDAAADISDWIFGPAPLSA
jgi:phospholipase/carboxylesterase